MIPATCRGALDRRGLAVDARVFCSECMGDKAHFQEDADLSASLQGFPGILRDGKVAVSFRLPEPLLVIIVLRGHLHVIRDEEDGVEANSKLPNEVDIPALLKLVQESCT